MVPFSIMYCLPVKFTVFISLPTTSIILMVVFFCSEEKEMVVWEVKGFGEMVIPDNLESSFIPELSTTLT